MKPTFPALRFNTIDIQLMKAILIIPRELALFYLKDLKDDLRVKKRLKNVDTTSFSFLLGG